MKKLLCCLLAIILSFSVLLSAFAADPVLAESITLDKDSVIIPVGRSVTLKVTITPKNTTNKKLEWISSDESIATVMNGKINAISCGTATITAKATDDSGVSASAQITVVLPVKKVSFSEKKITIAPQTTWQLSAEVMPEDASIKDLTCKSSNEKVVTVNENGLITGVGKGSANITAVAVDGSGAKASASVKVQEYDLVFTSKEPQIVNYYYGSGSFSIKGSVKTGNVSIPEINTYMMVMMVGGPAKEDVSVTPVNPGTDVVTIKVGSKKYKYTVYVSPEAFAAKEDTENDAKSPRNHEEHSDQDRSPVVEAENRKDLMFSSVIATRNDSLEYDGGVYKIKFNSSGDPGPDIKAIEFILEEPIDATYYGTLSFSIKDMQGSNTHKVTLFDSTRNYQSLWVETKSEYNQWKQIKVDLHAFDEIDLSQLTEIRIGEWNEGEYWFDQLFLSR